ncbi:enoyl-CoA hydratase/isomerase family protein [Maricaulis sp.]|uniref:enoyl-CoA hydratase/isomerase family protein n=1 Tax=Maricaulis sp. TaxID=1486257 RepID=UPI00262A6D08|nr:enoyl-CoA hydratase/isomerase family protein [Maricaulis sp.]
MTGSATKAEIETVRSDGIVRITLDRPHRGNALTPDLLDALIGRLDGARDARAVVLTGAGRAFSSGGDVGEFHIRADRRDALLAYADRLVSTLNRVILHIRAMPCPVIAAVNGPVTGGSFGLVLAADIAVMAESAFIQPYYAQMGFAPDGGWTALLPERIGRARTARWLALDERIGARQALEMGLADVAVPDAALDDTVARLLDRMEPLDNSVAATTRQLLDTQIAGPDLAARLENEKRAFLDRIAREETRGRMNAFLATAG